MSIKIKVLLSCLPLMFILSCGGGGGGGGGDDPGTDPGPGDTLNSGLPGKFFFKHYDNGAYTMDVDTGEYRLIPNTRDWSRQRDRFPNGVAVFGASQIAKNNTEFVVIASGNLESDVALQDYNGNYLGQTHFSGKVVGASLSQDGQYVALFREVTTDDSWFEIYNWNSGALISDKRLDSRKFIWLQDNRLLYAGGRTLYFTKPGSTDIDNSLTLPEPSGNLQAGVIGGITVSPDETQIVFKIVGRSSDLIHDALDSRLYMVNSDGTNLRLVATTPGDTGENSGDTSGPRVAAPQWSPDGRWLYVEEGLLDVGTIGGTEFYPDMYILPTEDMGKVFYLSTDESKRSPEVRRFWRYNTLPGEGGGVTGKALMRNAFFWISD